MTKSEEDSDMVKGLNIFSPFFALISAYMRWTEDIGQLCPLFRDFNNGILK